ncbi:hypothetical protein C5167_027684 [Papaver somniferum]|nr:hypothetical protein C5167_027684 [Papaver somniferum]
MVSFMSSRIGLLFFAVLSLSAYLDVASAQCRPGQRNLITFPTLSCPFAHVAVEMRIPQSQSQPNPLHHLHLEHHHPHRHLLHHLHHHHHTFTSTSIPTPTTT